MYLQLIFERWCSLFVRLGLVVSETQIVIESFLLRIKLRGLCELLCCCTKVLSFRTQQADIIMSCGNHLNVISLAALQFSLCFFVQGVRFNVRACNRNLVRQLMILPRQCGCAQPGCSP